jgi:hypothetical protein
LEAPVVAQAAPQSCAKFPTPKMPFAPNALSVFSEAPRSEQLVGTGKSVALIIWIGTELAFSPEI